MWSHSVHLTVLVQDDFGGLFGLVEDGCGSGKCSASVLLKKALNYDQKNVYTLEVIATVSSAAAAPCARAGRGRGCRTALGA